MIDKKSYSDISLPLLDKRARTQSSVDSAGVPRSLILIPLSLHANAQAPSATFTTIASRTGLRRRDTSKSMEKM